MSQIVAPSMVFKSEAIVHPDEVIRYVHIDECRLSYNPTLMALLWESLATRRVELLKKSLSHRHSLPEGTTWVNYLRCHDDIGWTFDDADAASLGINAFDHRNFLNRFYTGQFEGSFARGVPFQENGSNGDMRVSGTLASLAGLEEAFEQQDERLVDFAIQRMLLVHGVAMSVGGIPLLYLGEEWGLLNDYSFVEDPAKADDSRWIHRPKMDWDYLASLSETCESNKTRSPLEAKTRRMLFQRLQSLIHIRKQTSVLSGSEMSLVDTGSVHVLGYVRVHAGGRLVCLANFSEAEQYISGNVLRMAGVARFFEDLLSGDTYPTSSELRLAAYQLVWLKAV